MSKVLMLIAQVDFQPVEYSNTRAELEKAGIDVDLCAVTSDICVGKDGSEVKPDITVGDVNVDDYSAITVIGGPGAPELAKYESVLFLIKEFAVKKKIVSAICIAPTVLAQAEVLEGKKATVWNGDELQDKVLKKFGAEYVDEPVVVDGMIITADGPVAASDFGKAIVKAIKGE